MQPGGSILLVHEGQVLLMRRAEEPFKGRWDLPGGLCEPREHPLAAAERELAEETGLRARVTRLLGMWVDEYPPPTPQDETMVILSACYLAAPAGPLTPERDPGEVAQLGWFAPDALPSELAFPATVGAALAAGRRVLDDPGAQLLNADAARGLRPPP